MAINRIWQAGFETKSLEGATAVGVSISTVQERTGLWSAAADIGNANALYRQFLKTIPATRQLRVGLGIHATAYPSVNGGEMVIVKSAGANLVEVHSVTTTGEIQLIIGGVQQDVTIDTPLATGTWFHIGLDCKIDNAAGWAKVYLGTVEILSFAGNTGNADAVTLGFGNDTDAGAANIWYWDDIYVDDTTGEGAAAVVPDKKFAFVDPIATGNYAEWVGSDGNNVNNYLLVDEQPPNTADYVEEDTVDEFDSYDMSAHVIGVGEEVTAVIPIIFTRRYGVLEEIGIGTRYSGADVIGADQDPGSGAWSFLWERQITKPGGGAWNQAAIDAFEVVLKSRGTF